MEKMSFEECAKRAYELNRELNNARANNNKDAFMQVIDKVMELRKHANNDFEDSYLLYTATHE